MNSSGKRLIAGLSAFSLILTSAAAQAMAETTAASALKGTRLYGSNRYETAAEISKAGWNSSDYVVLASGESFADALCAAPLAKKLNAPILLTEKNALDPAAKAELKRLNAKHVIIIGMYGAVSKSAEDSAKAIAGDVKRIGGADRYETSVSIAKELGTSSEVAIASGEDYPDALSIASVAASEKMPILLTGKDALPGKVADYINTNKDNITKTYVIGSEGAVSENAAKTASKNEVRLGGKDRFDTNAKVLSSFEDKLNFKNVYVAVGNGAKGTGFADALSGAALASKSSSPVVLVYKDLAGETVDMLTKELAPKKNVIALGGTAVVSDSILTKINDIKIPAVVFSVDGETKGSGDVKSDNVEVDAKNVTLKDANISGNVYLYGDGAKLSNVKVAGTVYVDPGENGSVTLENVHAARIRVRSGAQNSIHLINVQSDKMVVESDNPSNSVRIESTGTTSITSTVVSSYVILDSNGGTLGTITITENGPSGKVVELRGKFTEPVVVDGAATVNVAAGATVADIKVQSEARINADSASNVAKVELATPDSSAVVTLAGKLPVVEINSSAKIEVASGANIGSITVAKGASSVSLDVPKDAAVKSVTGDGASNVTVTGAGASNVTVGGTTNTGSGTATTGGGSGSGSGSGNSGNGGKQADDIVTKVNAAVNLLNASQTIKNNFTIGQMSDSKVMNITIKNPGGYTYTGDVYKAIANKDTSDLQAKINALLLLASSEKVTVGGQAITNYLQAKFPKYYNNNVLDAGLIQNKIKNSYIDSSSKDFKYTLLSNDFKVKFGSNNVPDLTISDISISKIEKDNLVLYEQKKPKNNFMDKWLGLLTGRIADFQGTYKITVQDGRVYTINVTN